VNLFAFAATDNKGGQAMFRLFSGILGAIAVSLTFGAVQFASGSDLHGVQPQPAPAPEATINRDAKTDRADLPATAPKTQTISVRVDGLSDTSILVRVPVAQATRKETRNESPAPTTAKEPVSNRRTVACEPVVSVLTEVAKQLQPGRCIT
jgi:hypothetical protein